MKKVELMNRIELAQYIVDEYGEYFPKKGKVIDMIIEPGPFTATIVLEDGTRKTAVSLFAAKLINAELE